jgi:hypothetical protein
MRVCSHCSEQLATFIRCSKCNCAYYCNTDCEKAHLSRHKFSCCLGRPIDEADYLVLACQTEKHLTNEAINEEVAEAYGFRHFISTKNRQILFQLYCKLINDGGVGDEELREALQKDKLKEFILFRCSQLPRAVIRDEMIWLARQDGFAANSVSDFAKVMDSGKAFLGLEDRHIPFRQLAPEEKRNAYLFYCQILNGYMPDVDEDNWISLGFCTARDQDDAQRLGRLYRLLVKLCKFDEFWKAMAESTMVELFETYGLGYEVISLRNIRSFMGSVGKRHQSVWELKRFTRLSDPEPMRAVIGDYGFRNCWGPQERIALRRMYTDFFSSGEDEMKLHQACVKGRLAQFLESILGQLLVPPEILSNDYPIDGCGYMGMVFQSVSICPESMCQEVVEMHKTKGEKVAVLTIPDECDGEMTAALRERAAFLSGGMIIQTTNKLHGKILHYV